MVGFHLFYGEVLPTDRADAQLTLIDFSLGVVIKSPQVKVSLIMI